MEADDRERERDWTEGPLYEAVVDAPDLADPDLWKSNSFARLRTRLITTIKAEIAELEYHRARYGRVGNDSGTEKRLARAREVLALLRPEDESPP